MTDWKAMAKAANPEMTDAEIARLAAPLELLEAAFRPLVKNLPPDLEPLLELREEEEGQ